MKSKFVYKVAEYTIFYDDVEDFLQSYDVNRIIALYYIKQEDLFKVGLSHITYGTVKRF